MTTPEADLKTQMRKYLTKNGIYWVSIQNGFGAKPGDPDMLICIKGQFIALEVKSPEGRLSEIQKQREREIRDCGGFYFVIRSMEQLKSAIDICNL